MGCDIHGHLEIKVKNVWHHYNIPNIERNYRLFGKLAGVRDEQIKPISRPKGLPKDISVVTGLDYSRWGSDAHTCSWLNSDELTEVIKWQKTQLEFDYYKVYNEWGYFFGSSWESFNTYREDFPEEIEDVRFVFWFDN